GVGQVVAVAVGAALVVWFVTGLTGIPKSGDSVLFWLIAGLAVATPRVFGGGPDEDEDDAGVGQLRARSKPGAMRFGAVLAIAFLAVGAAGFTWNGTVQLIQADASAAAAVNAIASDVTVARRLADIDHAISLAPDVPRYHMIRSELYGQIAVAPETLDPAAALREAAESAARALALNPLDRDLNFRAAYIDWELAGTGDIDAAFRTYSIYERLALLTPQHPEVGPRLVAVGEALGLRP
ncbi:MAG: hypothetical protein O3C10_06080, partial [Chloroflexi bacterium]|nr:hypothetical protein [Chloroflexota bacterium]